MKGFISYVGGKSRLAKKIVSMMPDHLCYVEVFCGGAWVLFQKPESDVEIINDINSELITLYRVVQYHLDEFLRYLRWILVSREEFDRFKAASPETLTDIQRAVRFYYLTKLGFASRVVSPAFGLSIQRRPKLNLLRIEEDLSSLHLRLARVYVENLPYNVCIERADRLDTLFYLNPPYYGYENDYGKGVFIREDFSTLCSSLQKIEGKFLMSINDHEAIRRLFAQFQIDEVETTYSASGGSVKKVKELLIRNF